MCRSTLAGPPIGQIITQCNTPGQIALTYDDGPYWYTSQLLDLLDELDVKATFFLVGENFGRRMDEEPWAGITQRMYQTGHQLASHTLTHPDLETLSYADRAFQMQQNDDIFRSIIGVAPTYMRAPFLSCGEQCIADISGLGYYIIDTNLDTKDYENNTPETNYISQQNFDAELGDPSWSSPIVLAHDVHKTTVTMLTAHMVQTLRDRGFQPVTVGECLGDPVENWYRG